VGQSNLRRINAIHPEWNQWLILDEVNKTFVVAGHSNKVRYELYRGILTVYWDKFLPEMFLEIDNIFVHDSIIRNPTNIERLFAVQIMGNSLRASKISVEIPNSRYEISLRLHTSDTLTFHQIFSEREYDSPNLPSIAKNIVDIGANIGLATVFFGLRYSNANIFSVEPERGNFVQLLDNTRALGDRVRNKHAAVWSENGIVNVNMQQPDGIPLPAWAVQVSAFSESRDLGDANPAGTVNCYDLRTIIGESKFDTVDILKIDIEGAEIEVFSADVSGWLPRIEMIIIETHDRFRPGCEAAVRRTLEPMFEELPRSGESLFFKRKPR
jgi:FkbM family methyltransferase